jgi:uridine kinase
MSTSSEWQRPGAFPGLLFDRMKRINPAIEDLELYEFRYCLDNLNPGIGGWASVALEDPQTIESRVDSSGFYSSIQLKPRVEGAIVLDPRIVELTNMLFVGLVTGRYSEAWVRAHFYFDVRGFYFLHRTVYFTPEVVAHLGGQPLASFEQRQRRFERYQGVSYRDFEEANKQVDGLFIRSVRKLIAARGVPALVAIAGPTAAGKTEIVERLRGVLERDGAAVASIEMDNFLTDREHRERQGIDSLGREAIHFRLFRRALEHIVRRRKIAIPRYDFVCATSSHDLEGRLKTGHAPLEIEPADIVFVEGNFPFLLEEIVPLIGLKAVYLTDDAVRLKRKWKRDIDYRKKYEPTYFRNRFFKDQFLMAEKCYLPQLQVCDLAVDTTGAALWATPQVAGFLQQDATPVRRRSGGPGGA